MGVAVRVPFTSLPQAVVVGGWSQNLINAEKTWGVEKNPTPFCSAAKGQMIREAIIMIGRVAHVPRTLLPSLCCPTNTMHRYGHE